MGADLVLRADLELQRSINKCLSSHPTVCGGSRLPQALAGPGANVSAQAGQDPDAGGGGLSPAVGSGLGCQDAVEGTMQLICVCG